jgi:hypothetical protein
MTTDAAKLRRLGNVQSNAIEMPIKVA